MKLYFAGAESKDFFELLNSYNCNSLWSYYVLRRTKYVWSCKGDKSIFLDSGAFSVSADEQTIDINEYITFIKKTENLWKTYAVLDVIGDWKKTRENQEYMENKGLYPLAVFHYKSPKEELERMIKKYDYIALGGLVPISLQPKKIKNWLNFCFSIIRNKCKVHGFGITSFELLKRYPFYSVDSTSWLSGGRFGTSMKYNDFKMETAIHYSHKEKMLRNSMSVKGITDYKERLRNNVREILKMERDITKLWESRGIKYEV